ncbi:MAG: MarC family protein [Chlamydiia bacterium]|nr:MarC family protein [Chlamydiia bacterium]
MLSIAFALFIVANPLGQAPLFLSLIKDFDLKRQRIIMARELVASFLIAIFFVFLGSSFLSVLHVRSYTVAMCGGTTLFLVALGMIFPKSEVGDDAGAALTKEPFIVPIATPLIAGPGLLNTVILMSGQVASLTTLLVGISLAWCLCAVVLMSTPYLKFILGKSGLTAMEQLMGMLLTMLATRMFLSGLGEYLHYLSQAAG